MTRAMQEERAQLLRQIDDLGEKLRAREEALQEARAENEDMRARGEALMDKVRKTGPRP